MINVSGTANVLDLCRRLPRLERVVHVSTAYVAGRSEGVFAESDHDVGQSFRNTYEQSKWEAEYLVARSGLPVTIVRPSIVVGESHSGWTPSFNVIYWPLQAFARGLVDRFPADPAGLVDIVPVDHVVDVIVHAMAADGVLHAVAGDEAPTVAALNERAAALLGKAAPELDAPGSDQEHVAAVFAPYFDVGVRFGAERARAAGLEPTHVQELLPAVLDYARLARWGKADISRDAARARLVGV
jgi:long-chain acyl-CoA synthetase